MTKLITYNAADLLNKVLDFTEMTPNSKDWNINSLSGNPPRLIRFLQIESLFQAFFRDYKKHDLSAQSKSNAFAEGNKSIQFILSGEFIKRRTIKDYKILIRYIEDQSKVFADINNKYVEMRFDDIIFLYSTLLDYKKKLREILKYNSRYIEAGSPAARFAIYIANSISNELVPKVAEIDIILDMLLNPKDDIFTQGELITNYGFPPDDLDEVDADFM